MNYWSRKSKKKDSANFSKAILIPFEELDILVFLRPAKRFHALADFLAFSETENKIEIPNYKKNFFNILRPMHYNEIGLTLGISMAYRDLK